MRAIHRDPNARFPTAAAFADALEEAARAAGIIPATPRQVAAFLRDLKSEGVVATQRLPNGHALAMALAQGTPSHGAAFRDAVAAVSPKRGRWIAALAAGAFVLGLGVTILIVSSPGGGSKPVPAASSSGEGASVTSAAGSTPPVTAVLQTASSPEPAAPAPSATAPASAAANAALPALPPSGSGSAQQRSPGGASGPRATAGPAPSRKEFTPGGL
jgi:hypothetical protein